MFDELKQSDVLSRKVLKQILLNIVYCKTKQLTFKTN